ncbi:MAG: OmpA family protein [Flavobacteriaceae bacterium]|nr:OmpA family protein [Flavobacteriaceae bacterium]
MTLVVACKNSGEQGSAGSDEISDNETSNTNDWSNEDEDEDFENEFDENQFMQNFYSEEAIEMMLASGQISEEEAKQIREGLKNMAEGGNFSDFDPEKYGDSISNVLGDLEASLNDPETGTGTTTGNNYKPKQNKTEKERAVENLRKAMNLDRPFFIEEYLKGWYGYSREKRKMAFRGLASESTSAEEVNAVLFEFFEIDQSELDFLKQLPAAEKIVSESEARNLRDMKYSKELTAYLKSGKASEKFKALIDRFELLRKRTHRNFLQKSKKAREEFYKVNPGWYANTDESGDTYIDSHRNYIHLPLGKLSFADRLISHEMDIKNGNYPEGAVGVPDMAVEDLRIAHPKVCNLGTRGVLVLEFTDNAIVDVNGPDLYVFEMGAIEPTNLEISKDGENWIEVGRIDGGTAAVDIAEFVNPKETYNYIRLTDLVTSSTLPGADVDAVAAIGGALRLNLDSSVLFDTGKHELKSSASSSLQQLVASILEMPKGTIIIEGHTDNVGNPASNKTLSENRAKTVRDYLKTKLKGAYKFQIKGFGESQPVAPNDTDENKQKNRRVEILVIPS